MSLVRYWSIFVFPKSQWMRSFVGLFGKLLRPYTNIKHFCLNLWPKITLAPSLSELLFSMTWVQIYFLPFYKVPQNYQPEILDLSLLPWSVNRHCLTWNKLFSFVIKPNESKNHLFLFLYLIIKRFIRSLLSGMGKCISLSWKFNVWQWFDY